MRLEAAGPGMSVEVTGTRSGQGMTVHTLATDWICQMYMPSVSFLIYDLSEPRVPFVPVQTKEVWPF